MYVLGFRAYKVFGPGFKICLKDAMLRVFGLGAEYGLGFRASSLRFGASV